MSLSAVAVGLAFALDVTVGEPPERVHPVALFGRAVALLDRPWARPRFVGALAALALPVGAGLSVATLIRAVAVGSPAAGAVVGALALFASTSLRRLLAVGREVTALVESDPSAARERVRALAGRDASTLSPGRIRSAVVESLAENLADGLIGPLAGFALLAAIGYRLAASVGADPAVLALALAGGGAVWMKAVNTMDSMLGYRDKPVGWGAARLDDAAMWLPARASAVLLAAVARSPRTLVSARRWIGAVPSPNGGWPMGTLAAALEVRLEKPGAYVLNPAAALPTATDSDRAVRQVAGAGALAYLSAGVVTWL